MPSEPPPNTSPAPGFLDRLLRLFSDVRSGEAGTAVLLPVNLFLLLVGYYILKTVREPLILAPGGAGVETHTPPGPAGHPDGVVPLCTPAAPPPGPT